MKSILPQKAKRWLGAALAFAVTASFAATPDALIHRWSFNNSLEDTGSIGGMTVTLQGNAALYNKTSVRVQRGGDPVELGANPIPSDLGDTPFTIEVWATPTSLDTYRGMFSLGERSNTNAKGLMGVFHGFRQINYTGGYGGDNGPVWQAVAGTVNGGTGKNVAMTPGGISANTPYYFAYVVMPKGDGASATIIGYVYNASTGEQVGKSTMYTVTDWTTSQLAQSWFGLGTTPWGDATPGADYDEVRVWKTALTPGQVAAHVAHGPDAIPGDGSVSDGRLRTESATLAHRWSFNGSLADSVTGDTATMKGGYYAANGAVRFAGGNKGDYEIALGANMPSDSVTLEFFSTTRSLGWQKLFCLGNGQTDGISFSFQRGGNPAAGVSGLEIYDKNSGHYVDGIPNALESDKPYLFTFTFSCDGTDTVLNGYCIDMANPGVIRGQFSRTLAGWKLREKVTLNTFNLGWSFWGDGAPNADFDEVRVWNGVLSEAEVLKSAAAGADATINPSFVEAPEDLIHRWSFNGNLEDTGSIGLNIATIKGNAGLLNGNSVRVNAGGNGTSWVELGGNPIPSNLGDTPFTIEVWATPTSLQNYASVFSLGERGTGGDPTVKGLMGVFHGFRQVRESGDAQWGACVQPLCGTIDGTTGGRNTAMTQGELSNGTAYYFAYVVTPQGNGSATLMGYVYNAYTGALVGQSVMRTVTGWTTEQLVQSTFNLGTTCWNNNNPGADYDEVRVWKKALTADQVAVSVRCGPDVVPGASATVNPVVEEGKPATLLHRWSFNGSLADTGVYGGSDAVTFGTAKLVDGTSVATYKDGGWNTSYVSLGANMIPASLGNTPFTVEMWATPRDLQVYLPAFTLGKPDDSSASNDALMFVFHGYGQIRPGGNAQNAPVFQALGSNYQDKNVSMSTTALTVGTRYHVSIVVEPQEGDTVTITGYVHDDAGNLVGSGAQDGITGWNATTLTQYAFLLGRNPWHNANPSAEYDEVRIWSRAFTAKELALNAVSGPDTILDHDARGNSPLLAYDFTSGAKSYSGLIEDPVTTAAGYTAVHGTNGYGTAVHAAGYGTSDAIRTTLAGEWSLATSFKSCDIEKGVILSLGNIPANGTKQLAILSSSTEGRLYAAVVQRWGGATAINRSLDDQTIAVSGADFANEFHTLVVTHVPTDAANTGVLTVYVDGVQVHQFTTVNLGQERAFGNGIRFGALMDNGRTTSLPSDIKPTAYCPDTAFQNVRLYDRLLSADEIAAYAAEFPAAAATKGSIGDYGFRHSFSTGKLVSDNGTFASTGGFNDNGLVGTGTAVDAPAYAAEGVKACFPDKTGYGTVTGGLNRDWTIAMSVKGPTVVSGNPAAMFSFGGVEESGRRSIALCSSSTGSLFVQMVQRWSTGEDAVNAPVSIDLGGDTSSMFHTLVIVNERNIKTDENLNLDWKTGMISFYLDGEYVGALESCNGQDRSLMDMIRYGALYNRTHESVVEPDAASGLSFQDLRFIPQVWTGAEAKDYAAAFPVAPTANVTLTVGGEDDFAGSQQIAITGGGQIYYTLDGSEPTPENGTLYAGAFTLAGSAQFKARAFADGTPVSQTVSRMFTEATDTAAYDYVFRYNFTDGVKNYNHHGCATEPAGTAAGYAAVHGTNGYAKAIHPTGYGTIVDGMARLNNDWTLAMCVKPGDLEKGILLSLGDNNAVNTKELAICSSSTAGRIHVAVVQKWTTDTGVPQYKNLPFAYDIPVGGDTAGSFHSLVVTHVAKTAYDAGTGEAWSGVITFYWDGVNVGGFDSSTNGGEREFGNGFKFGGLHDGSTAWLAQQGYVETAYDVESAFRDVRFYARTLTADEIAGYAAMFPATDSTSGNIGTFDFRHDFTGGSLAVTGSAFTDGGIAAATKEVLGPVDDDAAKAAWPGMSGYGTIGGVNMNGDWTLAMSVKAPKVSDDEKGIIVSLGGVNAKGTKALAIGSTADSTGGLFFGLAQRWGGDTTAINTCNGQVTLAGLGDTTKEFHSLVVVHASGLRTNNDSGWKTGTYAIYWDGVYKGAVATNDGAGQNIGNFIKYGSLHDRMPPTPENWGGNYPHYTETDSSESGLAFRDLRFAGRMWTGTEVKAYSQAFPAVKQKSRGITVLVY